ncbi:MAG: hypothetical protein RL216_2404 [Pseudomonadota bacterium]|jgi:hypothetical protein
MPRIAQFPLISLTALLSAAGFIFMLVMGHTDPTHLGVAALTGVAVALATAPMLVWSKE